MPTTRSPIPRSARNTTRAGGCSGALAAVDLAGGPFGPAGGGGPAGGFATGDLSDLFSNIFSRGGGGGRAQPQGERGRDLETEVSLSFDQAVNGAQVNVTVPKAERCPTCHGNGAKPGTSPVTCPRCEGRGIDAQSQGFFSISQPCPQCGGAGQIIEDPCPTCHGSGLTQQTKRYKVNIPAGVKNGARIRLAGKGEAGQRGGPPGDLFVVTRVAASPVFKRLDGGNLEVTVPITIAEALRGATIEVPTLEGTKKIKVGPGTKHGSIQRLRGAGRAEGKGPRQGRHPLPARDRDAREADRRAGGGGGEAGRGLQRLRPPRRSVAQGRPPMTFRCAFSPIYPDKAHRKGWWT